MERTYRIAEFAKLAGVTVRTLQFYHRKGLLEPSAHTTGGHRLYLRTDLVRLQQIVALKWMGFSLDQIQPLLSNMQDIHASLVMQRAAVQQKITHLQDINDILGEVIAQVELGGEDLNSGAGISDLIRKFSMNDGEDWLEDYYSEASLAGLFLRSTEFSATDQTAAEQAWQEIHDGFSTLHTEGLEADSEPAQQLAAKMFDMITRFTGGDAQTEAELVELMSQSRQTAKAKQPAEMRRVQNLDDGTHTLMQTAFEIFKERNM